MNSPEISVVVEWENVLLAEKERCVRMLWQLRHQSLALPKSMEILVLFNPGQVHREIVEQAVNQHLRPPDEQGRSLTCRIVPGDDLHYYQLKNLGAKEAQGRVIVFVDSDVIPESAWLQELTQPFHGNPEIKVVGGNTYLDPESLVSRAFALGWFFPLRRTDTAVVEAKRFYANNVAFRQEVLKQHPFPEMAQGMTRGACRQLAQILHQEGIATWSAHAAQTSHPAPNGWNHILIRGLAEGRDWAMSRMRTRGVAPWRSGLSATRQVLSRTWRMQLRTLKHGRHVGLPLWQAPFAVAIMFFYYLEICVGAWAYSLAPESAREWWRI